MRLASSSQIDVAFPAPRGARFSLKNGSMVFVPCSFMPFSANHSPRLRSYSVYALPYPLCRSLCIS